ncbi:nucleotide disphospho-sugar-binding domain-containing protein [Rhodococcus qingshengii]|uniref:nucleotide disphospho-sugar-binding domain-containing protein n=1 Tax=Rhodococcus qingshengii TaxID=334542 RepID=UPI0036DA6FAD
MRVLIATYSDRSLLQSLVQMAAAFAAAGHEVRVASAPDLADTITAAGLTAVPVGRNDVFRRLHAQLPASSMTGLLAPYDAAVDPSNDTWEHLLDGYQSTVRWWHQLSNAPLAADLVAFARSWRPDLVLWEPTTYCAPIAAEACGAAHGRVLWSVDVFAVTRDLFLRRRPPSAPDPLGDWLAGHATRHGVAFSERLITGMFTVDPLPESVGMRAESTRVFPVRYMPYGGPATVPTWLRTPPQRPRVAVTLGITNIDRFGGYNIDLQGLLDALTSMNVEVVAMVAESEQGRLERVAPSVRVVPFVPLDDLAACCSLVVHHGGPGTMLTVARHAVPQLILPWEFDAPELARRFATTGAGLVLDPAAASVADVRTAARRLLTEPWFGAQAAALRDEMIAAPTPIELVAQIERLVHEFPGIVV